MPYSHDRPNKKMNKADNQLQPANASDVKEITEEEKIRNRKIESELETIFQSIFNNS
jgi:hypothetical protein